MAYIGLLGREYDGCIRLLKARIEDRGHRARVVDLELFPRVARATVDAERLLFDGADLFEMDSYYLKEMEIRDPFFHVQYDEELWGMLRERYLSFAGEETENILFTRDLLEILAAKRPVINHPRVYAQRNELPYQLNALAGRGFAVQPFRAGTVGDGEVRGTSDAIPVRLDEERIRDVYSFPKGERPAIGLRRERGEGSVYTIVIVDDRPLDRALADSAEPGAARPIACGSLPAGAAEVARGAAAALGAVFAAVELRCGGRDGTIRVLKVDPSPEFAMLERMHGLPVSEALADCLIAAGSP